MKRFFARFFKQDEARRNVAGLYGTVMTAARNPVFFGVLGLNDSFEVRFELLTLHMFLVLSRLKTEGAEGKALMQSLTEYMVDDLDRSIREAGIGDVGVSKRMKKLMSAFYGRLVAYENALAAKDDKEMLRALDRNLFAEHDTNLLRLEAMRGYIMHQRQALAAQPVQAFAESRAGFAASGL